MSTSPTLVQFRPEFSDELVGVTFEVDDPTVRVDRTTPEGREFVSIRIRQAKRWGYRLAYVSDLRLLDGSAYVPSARA